MIPDVIRLRKHIVNKFPVAVHTLTKNQVTLAAFPCKEDYVLPFLQLRALALSKHVKQNSEYLCCRLEEGEADFKGALGLFVAAPTGASAKLCWLQSKRAAWWTRCLPHVNNICR